MPHLLRLVEVAGRVGDGEHGDACNNWKLRFIDHEIPFSAPITIAGKETIGRRGEGRKA
jgi:hypothetical protein